MSKTRRRAKPGRARPAFVPLVLVAAAGAPRESLEEKLAAALDVEVRAVEPDTLGGTRSPIRSCGVALVVPGASGEVADLVDRVRDADAALPVVVSLEDDRAEPAVAALRAGAQDVLVQGHLPDESRARIAEWIRTRATREEGALFGDGPGVPRMLGAAPEMREVARLVERVADAQATVLILGESGTGKELVARAIHALSPRRDGPFVAINCAAIPETLLENELFGHERGAYTGATSTAIGKVEAANGGTLFLDEIGEMPLPLQAKILRLMQEKTYDRIGGTAPRAADIRIVTATNRDLKTESAAGRFREDLYFRLSVVPVTLPPLRDRPRDVPVLARDIVRRLADAQDRPGLALSDGAVERLVTYRWPGNVRELENALERASVMARTETIEAGDIDLGARVDDPERAAFAAWLPLDGTLEEALAAAGARAESLRVSVALEASGGDREAAARALGISLERLDEAIARFTGDD